MSIINKVHGKAYRILKDATNKEWDEISFNTDSRDVFFQDGLTAEAKVGSIKGVVTTDQSVRGYVMDASVTALAPKVFNGTISSGAAKTLTFIDSAIKSTSKIVIYTDLFGYVPTNSVVSGNTLTITFPAPSRQVLVKVEVSEFHY